MENIIQIKQLPVIEERLKSLENAIKTKTDTALSLVVNEETFKEIKKTRAELNKEFAELETLRKQIKTQVLKPYEEFEKIYKEVTGHYSIADKELAEKIGEVEQVLINLEYEFITFEKMNLSITLTSSLKSLKEKAKEFLEKINSDTKAIKNMEHSDDLMFEYSKYLDIGKAMVIVAARLKAIEEQRKAKESVEQKEKEKQEVVKKVEQAQQELAPPVEQLAPPKEQEKEYKVTFTVTGTKEKLKELKIFLENGGYKYE